MIRISLFANYKFALDAPQSTAVVVVVGGSDFCQGFFSYTVHAVCGVGTY